MPVLTAAFVAAACDANLDSAEPIAITKLAPASVSIPEAWRLFDRSVASTYTPGPGPVAIDLDHAAQLRGFKVFGPAPYRIELRGTGGSSLGLAAIDLSAVSPGWHVVTANAPVTTSHVELRFTATGAGGGVPELELWAQSEPAIAARRVELTAGQLPASFVSVAASPSSGELSASDCAGFEVNLARSPALLRNAHLVYDARGLFRSFAVARAVNGLAPQGGQWLTGDDAPRTIVDEIDPVQLRAGTNEVTLCAPDAATGSVAISNLRVVGELDTGVGQATAVAVGDARRDGSAALDGDPATRLDVAPGERVEIAFDRLIAPDALVLTGSVDRAPLIACVGRAGERQEIAAQDHATATGRLITLEGGGAACAAIIATFERGASVGELDVIGSGAAEPVDWPRVVVTSAPEHFGAHAWVGGFVTRPPAMTGAIRVDVAGEPGAEMTGAFGALLARSDALSSAWPVSIVAHLPDGTVRERKLVLGVDHATQLATAKATGTGGPRPNTAVDDNQFGGIGESVDQLVAINTTTQIRLGTRVGVDVPAGALVRPTTISVGHLAGSSLPPLDPGMVNVTAPKGDGYEFLPHGQQFVKPVSVIVPFDPALIPEGHVVGDIQTFFFDPVTETWKPLPPATINLDDSTAHSATNHFTVMVNAILAVPTDPKPLSLDPTALSSIGAATPGTGIDLIEPPQAVSTGEARTALPIRVPEGRGAYTPSLAIGYASNTGNSWLGVGWDLHLSRIEIDTRWGAATYADGDAVRYAFDGTELVPTQDGDGPSCAGGATARRYHARIEGGFAHILRCGDSPSSYHWEVHDRNGTLLVFGESAGARLASYESAQSHNGIFRWGLERVVDVHGNTTQFHYAIDDDTGSAEPSREIYPASIDYTSTGSLASAYSIVFDRDDGTRPDRIVSGRAGFKVVTRHLLRTIHVKFHDQIIRDYVLSYTHGQFDKSVLASVKVYGAGGCAAGGNAFAEPACSGAAFLDQHAFDYFQESQGFADAQTWQVASDPDASAAALGKGATASVSGGAGVTVGEGDLSATAGVNGSYAGRKELVGLYDMNGDGLPDEVFDTSGAGFLDQLLGDTDGSITVLYNQSHPGIDPASDPLFAPGAAIHGLGALGGERVTSWGLTVSGKADIVKGSVGFAESTSRARRLLADLDGDGFTDLVNADGDSLLSAPCSGATCFTTAPFGATRAVDPRNDPLLQGFAADIKSRTFMGDPVVQWTAPFDGMVTVSGVATKLRAGGLDGVTVEIYHQDSLLASRSFAPGDTGSVTFPAETPVEVAAGETIYVRVRTGDDDGIAPDGTLFDLVDERLSIAYASACTALGCGDVLDPVVMKEPTGGPVFSYDTHDDFRVSNAPSPLIVLAGGTLALHAQIAKQVSLANLRACVQQFATVNQLVTKSLDRPCATSDSDVTNLSGTQVLLAESTAALPLDVTASVQPGQLIVVRVESDLTFDPVAVSLQPSGSGPIAAYTQVCLPNLAGTGSDCSTDPQVIASVPLPLAGFSAFVNVPSFAAAIPFVAPGDGAVTMTAFTAPSGPYVFAVRSDRHGVIAEIDCPSGSCGSTISILPFDVVSDESVTFELVTPQGLGGPATVAASFREVDFGSRLGSGLGFSLAGAPQTIPLAHRAFAPAPLATPFAGGFRGVRAAFWNEAEAFAPTQLLFDLQAPLLLTQDRRDQIARSIVLPLAAPAGTVLTAGAPAWLGPQSAAFVTASGLSASDVGGSAGAGTAGDRGGVFDGNYARLSGTQSLFIAAGLVGVPGLSFDLQASKSSTDTTTDVVDMNGDGVLDVVTQRTTTLGALTGATGGAGTAGFDFGDQLRHRAGHEYEVGFGGNAVVRRTTSSGRTLDVDNSDGPDTGFLGLSAGRGLALGRTQTTKDLIDLNGDGLPDLVERDGATVRVRLNLGGRFGAAEAYGQLQGAMLAAQDSFEDHIERNAQTLFDSTSDALQHETTITTDESGGFNFVVVACNHSSKHTSSRITRQLVDINGDGLPDLLYKKHGDNQIQVQLNRGGDFGPVIAWSTTDGWPVDLGAQLSDVAGELLSKLADLAVTGPDVLAGSGSQESTSNGCSVQIPIYAFVSLDFSAGEAGDKDTYELALIDIDGDGVADHVLRKGHTGDPGTVYVKHNLVTGKANLLRAIHRPLGGTITLDYARTTNSVATPHSFEALARVDVDDGVDLGTGFASPDVVTEFSYENGFYDRREKEFLGFAKVTTRRGDGMTAEEDFANTSYALHGLMVRESRRDAGGNLFQQHDVSYAVADVIGPTGEPVAADPQCVAHLPTSLVGVADACTPRFPIVIEDNDARYEGGSTHKTHRMVTAAADRDRFGNQLVTTDLGDDAIASDDTVAQAAYRNDVASWILGRPTAMQVRAGSASGALLRSRTGDYDALGELIALHGDTGTGIATTTLGYDAFGNLAHVETPPNEAGQTQTYDVVYDADTATHPVQTSDGFGLVSTASYDLRFGIATSEIDVNHVELRRTLDAFGRVISVSGPYDTATAGLTMVYHPEESPPRAVTTMHPAAPADYTGPVPAPITTETIYDGLERTIEVRKTAVVDGVIGVTTSGVVARDTAGRVVKTQNPFFTAGASTGFIAPQVTLAAAISYDAFDRAVSTQYPDGAIETASFAIAAAPSGDVLFQHRTVDANGHARETYVDHAGLVRALVEHAGATDALVTSYDYLATGELSHITGPDGVQSSLGYDLVGRRTSLDNPDSGLVTYQYDLMGNRISVVEPNHRALGTRVHYIFDRDRIASIDYPSKPDVTYSYGAPGAANFSAGRLVQVADETGNQQHSYGALGELRRTVRSFHDPGHQVGDAVFDQRFTTDSFARVLRVAYPDGEVVTNTFDAAGQLAQVDGVGSGWSRSYASGMRYDVFDNRTRMQLGNGDVSVWTFDPARVRLTSLVTTLASSTKVQDLHYTYDPAGNPTRIDNNLPATPTNNTLPGTATQSLFYDGVDRLVHATGSGTQGSNKTTTFDFAFSYSTADSLMRKTAVHQVINHNGTVNLPADTNYDASYSYGSARPHLPTQIGSLALAYDASGNPTSRTDGGVVQQLIWDDDNRLVQVQGAGANQRNLYDAEGLRVLRHGRGNTIFASAFFEYDNAATGTKHVFAGATHVATVQAHFTSGANPSPPTKQGTPFYLHDNQLGSTAVVTTAGGDVNDAHEYFPDGAAWIESGHGGTVDGFLFEGKPLDPDTGFYDFGQRFYDPKTSIWLGIDDHLTSDTSGVVGKRAGLAPIAFAANNPLRFIDPDGRDVGEFFGRLGHYGWGVVKGATYPIRHPIKTAVGVYQGTKAVVEFSASGYAKMYIAVAGTEEQKEAVRQDQPLDRAKAQLETYMLTRTPEEALEDFGDLVGGFVGPAALGKAGALAKARVPLINRALNKLGRLGEAAELKPYNEGGGHHVPAKSAFEGAEKYNLRKALAIPDAELKRLGVVHTLVTASQQTAYRALAKAGKKLTWRIMARIETDALIAGRMRADMARATVAKAIKALKAAGVEAPTRIPWGD